MKKSAWLVVMLCAAGLIFSACEKGCQKKGPEEEVVVEKTEIIDVTAADKVSKSLSEALCKRMVECVPDKMTEQDCVAQTTISLVEAQKQKPIQVSDDQLQTCIASITKGTCDEVLGTEPPQGCEFLK